MVPWLGLCTLTAEGPGLITGWGTRTLQAMWHSQKKKKRISPNIYACLWLYVCIRIGVSSQSWPDKGIMVIERAK